MGVVMVGNVKPQMKFERNGSWNGWF